MPRRRQSDRQAGAREVPELRRRPHRSARVKTPTPPDERLEEAVCEAVFQYQLQQPLADAPHPLRYYVARQGRDPSGTVLGRLRRLTPGVQPFSQCRVSGRDGVVDRTTGARGVILQVARVTWPHATAVDVVGGYYLTHRQAASFRYHLEPHDGRWAVTVAHLLWRV
jgi:hypothetical protein